MSFLVDEPTSARYQGGKIQIVMQSGLEISFPIEGNSRLAGASPGDLDEIEVSPMGLHWPRLDEDLSIRGILAGDYGQRMRRIA